MSGSNSIDEVRHLFAMSLLMDSHRVPYLVCTISDTPHPIGHVGFQTIFAPKYYQVVGGWIKWSIDPDYSILINGNSNFIANTRFIEFVTVNLSRWILALFMSPKMSAINSQSKDGINFGIT